MLNTNKKWNAICTYNKWIAICTYLPVISWCCVPFLLIESDAIRSVGISMLSISNSPADNNIHPNQVEIKTIPFVCGNMSYLRGRIQMPDSRHELNDIVLQGGRLLNDRESAKKKKDVPRKLFENPIPFTRSWNKMKWNCLFVERIATMEHINLLLNNALF